MSPRSGLELQSHRFRLRTYQNCLVGKELVDWLLTYEKTSTRYKVTILFYFLSFYILSSSFLAGPKQQSALSSELCSLLSCCFLRRESLLHIIFFPVGGGI